MTVKARTRPLAIALLLCLPATVVLAEEEERAVSGFHAIAVGGGIDVSVHQGAGYKVSVHTDDGDTDEVETDVEGEKLVIRKSSSIFGFLNWFHLFEHFRVEVTLPALDYVSAGGGSNVVFDTDFAGDQLQLKASGGVNMRFKGKVAALDVNASGGSDVYLDGSGHLLKVTASGGSDIHALKFEAVEADLRASGGSDIVATVHDKLSARASGGSDIRYEGHPDQTDVKASGGSDIRAR